MLESNNPDLKDIPAGVGDPYPPARMWRRGEYEITTDPARIDLDLLHGFLSEEAYWSRGVSREVVERSIEHSLNFVLLRGDDQVGFARVVSDYATFAWLADVFVLDEHRGRGLGTWLVETALSHPDVQGLRRWILATGDAHGLYARFGFASVADDSRFMVVEKGPAMAPAHRR
jgi:N-acetylglutamate synthase-like GNAT family acetyltransferase